MSGVRRGAVAGFTLIELLVTIAIAAILMMVAAPSFVAFQRNSELTSATNELVGAMNVARGEALKRGTTVMIVPLANSDWSKGWRIFADANRNNAYDSGDPVIAERGELAGYFTASALTNASTSVSYAAFDASGYSKTTSAAFQSVAFTVARNDLSAADTANETRRVVVSVSGRVRSCKPATDTTCTANAAD